MKFMGLNPNAPRSQRKAKQARQKRRETWMAGLGGRAGSNAMSLKARSNSKLFKHHPVQMHRGA